MSHEAPVLAYFFPQDEADPHRMQRATALGVETPSDLALSKKRYCLGDPRVTYWTDADPSAIAMQMELAKEAGVGFIIDTYIGFASGGPVEELGRSLDLIAQQSRQHDIKIASMFCLKLPRAVIPVESSTEEPNRWLDVSHETARAIVDRAAGLWEQPNHLRFNNRPYISIYGILHNPTASTEMKADFVAYIREYALATYGINPLIFGVGQKPQDILNLQRLGFDASTQYAGLPDFEEIHSLEGAEQFQIASDAEDIQFHKRQLELAVSRRLAIDSLGHSQFYPSVSVGWDASARSTSDENKGYPSSPVVKGSTAETLQKGLIQLWSYFIFNTELPYVHFPIFAWNEVAENGALLPTVNLDGTIDMSNIEVVRAFNRMLRSFPVR